MKTKIAVMAHALLAALDPVTALSVALGSVAFGVAFDGGGRHLLSALGGGLIIVAAVEWSIQRRFQVHERVEAEARRELLSAQSTAFQAWMIETKQEIKEEVGRMAAAFDGLAATYDMMRKALEKREEREKLNDRP